MGLGTLQRLQGSHAIDRTSTAHSTAADNKRPLLEGPFVRFEPAEAGSSKW